MRTNLKAYKSISDNMSPEEELLLCCARVSVSSETADRIGTLLQQRFDWERLFKIASEHGMLPLLYWNLNSICSKSLPTAVMERLRNSFHANTEHNMVLTAELVRLSKLFEANQISSLPFKGPVLAMSVYGNLALRQFGDLDILVKKSDFIKAKEILVLRGFKPASYMRPLDELTYLKSNKHKDIKLARVSDHVFGGKIVVELHWAIAASYFSFPLDYDHLWKRLDSILIAKTKVRKLNSEDQLLVLCVHGSKHYWGRLMWICDVAELIKVEEDLDWESVLLEARRLGCERMLFLGLLLANELLGAPLPCVISEKIESQPIVKELAQDICQRLFNHTSKAPEGVERYPYYIKMRERREDKIGLARYYAQDLISSVLKPNRKDRSLIQLPRHLSFLYYLLRPARLSMQKFASQIPFKRQVFSVVRVFNPPKRIYSSLRFNGKFKVKLGPRNYFYMNHSGSSQENGLFWRGLQSGYEGASLCLWMKLCANVNVIVDVGANTGIYSLVGKAVNRKAAVFGFEPIDHLCQQFKGNCKLNRFDIRCIQQALSNRDGISEIFLDPQDSMIASLSPISGNSLARKIPTLKLSTFILEEQIRIDLMKIDVESWEPQVLEGMENYLDMMRPTMVIEILNDEVGEKVEKLVTGKGYLYFHIDEAEGPTRRDHLRRISRESRNYLLCNEAVAKRLDIL